jgi:hypothetical protein
VPNPQYFSRRAARYRELSTSILYVKLGDELRDIAALFDRMADSARDRNLDDCRLQHRKIVKALEGAVSGWMNTLVQ